MEDKVIVHYFKIFGRAEPIRMLLWYANIPYENKYLPRLDKVPEEWAKVKDSLQFGQAPMVEIDGLRLTQTFAILIYLSEKIGILPDTLKAKYLMNSANDLLRDLVQQMFPVFFSKPEQKEEAVAKFLGILHTKIGYIENRLKQNESQEFMIGNKFSLSDLLFTSVYYNIILRGDNQETTIEKIKEAFKEHSLFVEYCTNIRKKYFKEYFDKVQITPEI